jgi:hypothetical protein
LVATLYQQEYDKSYIMDILILRIYIILRVYILVVLFIAKIITTLAKTKSQPIKVHVVYPQGVQLRAVL